MTRTTTMLAAALAALWLGVGCDDKSGGGAATAAPAPTTRPAPTATATAAPTPTPPPAQPSAVAGENFTPGPAKTFACGSKENPCPMQRWMKTVMAGAASSGEGDKLAQALTYVLKHPPPGYDKWPALSQAGIDKAKAGDVDGAKAACKQCHDLYKEDYKATMRDRPF
jgi:hypothetical protein